MLQDIQNIEGVTHIFQFSHEEVELFSYPTKCDERMKRKIYQWKTSILNPSLTTIRYLDKFAILHLSKHYLTCILCHENSNIGEIRKALQNIE